MPLTDQQKKTVRATLAANTCGCGGLNVPWKGMNQQQIDALTDNELIVYDQWLSSLAQAADRSTGQAIVRNANVGGNSGVMPLPPPPPPPSGRANTMEQWLNMMPPEAQPVWNSIVELHNQQRGQLIGQLMEHLTDETQRQLAYNRYKDMSVKDLQEMLLIMPRPQQAQNTQQTTPIYWGSQGGPPPSLQVTDEQPLLAPIYNFDDHRLKGGKAS
jgi:hypothetical protein